jgi:outer membrane protein TolC
MKVKRLFFTFVIFSIIAAGLWSQEAEVEAEAEVETTVTNLYNLEDLLSATQMNHPELLKLQEEYKRSLLDVKDAWWSLGPTVDLQASGTYMLNPPLGAMYINTDDIINAIQWNGVKPRNSGQRIKIYDGMENTLYNFELTLTQPVFTWGKITNAIKLYKQVSEIKLSQITQQTAQLETELKTRLISLYYLNKILEIIDEEETYTDRMVEVSENAEKVGMLLHQDVVDAKIQAKELEIAKQDLLEQINDQLLELKRTSGIELLSLDDINFDFVTELEESFTSLMEKDPSELESQALSGNQSSIKILTQLEGVSQTAEKIARGYENWKPDLALQMSGGYSGSRFPLFEPNWRRKDDYSLNISIGLKATIWDGGKKVRDVSRKVSESETAQINKANARSTISKTFNSQWNAAQVCKMKIEYQELKIESAAAKISQKEQIYESGYGSETDVLSAKIERCNAQIEKEKQALTRAAACLTIEYLIK